MTDRVPAVAFPPGEYLADELEARGWSQADFAEIIGRPVQFVSEIINAKKELTVESAAQIAAALGSEATTWLGLQTRYQLWRLAQNDAHRATTSHVATRAQIAEIIPLAQMEKRGIIDPQESMPDLLAEVVRIFNGGPDNASPAFSLAAKRANGTEALSLTQRGWLWEAHRAARKHDLPPYDADGFRRLVEGLRTEIAQPDDLADLPQRFASVGVHLVFVEHLAGGKIDGAAFMLDERPVVAVSGRGKRFDKLYFALLHECGHVLKRHIDGGAVALDDLADQESIEANQSREDEANDQAESWCLGGPVRIPSPISAQAVADEAGRLGVPPSFVLGNLQHHGLVPWRTTLAKGIPNADHVLRAWATT